MYHLFLVLIHTPGAVLLGFSHVLRSEGRRQIEDYRCLRIAGIKCRFCGSSWGFQLHGHLFVWRIFKSRSVQCLSLLEIRLDWCRQASGKGLRNHIATDELRMQGLSSLSTDWALPLLTVLIEFETPQVTSRTHSFAVSTRLVRAHLSHCSWQLYLNHCTCYHQQESRCRPQSQKCFLEAHLFFWFHSASTKYAHLVSGAFLTLTTALIGLRHVCQELTEDRNLSCSRPPPKTSSAS